MSFVRGLSTFSNDISSEAMRPNFFIFHIIASIGRGIEKLCFYSNRIRTLVAMATYSSHRIWEKRKLTIFSVSLGIFGIFFYRNVY